MANEIYNTTWWGNAIDTAITAGTEPDFFGSQMKMLTGQPELVTNGDFATDSDWTKGTGWSIGDGVAVCNGSQSGNSNIYQSTSFVVGKTYKVSYELSDVTAGAAKIVFGDTGGTLRSVNGTYTEYYVFVSGTKFYIQANADFVGSIDNVSVKLVRAEEVEAVKCLADWIHTTALQDLNN